ncbi:MAG: hypothetical protein CO129_04415 [Ignavibacteriales bacterium CG_4_9_14_3_um_filter_34_10]|nr:MAG: hypothetical protein CO129_04415 [Ignavibacteriales bacterium CG_4_9_14_3_um_filter_34_10]
MENKVFHNLREQENSSIKDYINLIKINFLPVLLISLTGLIVASLYAIYAIDIYKSTVVLKVAKPSGSILNSPLMPEFSDFGSDRFIANEIEILKSEKIRSLIIKQIQDSFKVIDADSFYLVLDQDSKFFSNNKNKKKLLPYREISKLLEKVSIDQKRGLDIIEISVESPSPFEAAFLANAYAKAYESLNLSYNRQQLVVVRDFLMEQREEKYHELILAEEKLKNYQEKGGIIALDEQAKSLIAALSDFQSQRDASQIEVAMTQKALDQYKEELEKKNPSLTQYIESYAAEPRLKSLQEQIAKLETQRDLAIANKNVPENKRLIKDYDESIKELKLKLDEQLKIYKTSIFALSPEEVRELSLNVLEQEVKLISAQSKKENLEKIVGKYDKKFNELPSQTIDLARYQRELSAYEKLYLLVEEKYQEALINEQSTPGNVLIIDEARRPELPSKPNRMLIVLVGLVIGVGMGAGFAFVKNYFDNSVKTPEDIQNNDINVLAWIPQIDILEENKDFEFIVAKKPDSLHAEAYRALRTRIQFSKLDQKRGIQTLLVTSSAPREGKTTTAVNIAGTFAQANKRTVIVDCDLRKPRMHTVFKAQRFPGFSDYFFGQSTYEEIIHKSELPNLFYITAGTIPPNPSELLSSDQMVAFLEKLKSEFDMIVIDSPPIVAVTDSEIISRLVDAAILVVSANNTEIELMRKAAELLTHESKSFIGAILNNFSYKSGYGSYYKYYYYYSHQSKGNGVAKVKKIDKV